MGIIQWSNVNVNDRMITITVIVTRSMRRMHSNLTKRTRTYTLNTRNQHVHTDDSLFREEIKSKKERA